MRQSLSVQSQINKISAPLDFEAYDAAGFLLAVACICRLVLLSGLNCLRSVNGLHAVRCWESNSAQCGMI